MLRSFLPVGQGAFYCEQFSHRPDREKVNIIYDCGSSANVKLVERQIKNNFEKGEVIHALFISHLDDDHTNGIPFLLKYCKVMNMFFPLLTTNDKIYLNMQYEVENRGRDSFALSFINNPRFVFERYYIRNAPILHPILSSQQEMERNYREFSGEPIRSGQDVAHIVFGNTIGDYKAYQRWLYIPHNFRQSDRLCQLQNELNIEFDKDMDNEDLHDRWSNGKDSDRRKIRKAYQAVKGSLNTNSMTLYSGLEDHACRQRIAQNRCLCKCSYDGKAAGCLYMGDYDASGAQKWKEIQGAYDKYWKVIGCLQVPHHGSRHNYNTELAELDAYYVISAGTRNNYQHPHSMVIKDLLFHGRHPYIVTENQGSALQLLIHL